MATALVTGASSGIGERIRQTLCRRSTRTDPGSSTCRPTEGVEAMSFATGITYV